MYENMQQNSAIKTTKDYANLLIRAWIIIMLMSLCNEHHGKAHFIKETVGFTRVFFSYDGTEL